MLWNFKTTITWFSFWLAFFGGILRLEVAKEGNAFGFWFCFSVPHMAVLLTGKPPAVNWMMLYSYRAKPIPSRVAKSPGTSKHEPYPLSRVRRKKKSCIWPILLTQGKNCCFPCWGC